MEEKELEIYTLIVTVEAESKERAISEVECALDGGDVEWVWVKAE